MGRLRRGMIHGPDCDCGPCKKRYTGGGTMDSTNFRSVPQRNDPSVTNHYFNTPGDGGAHGHVKERENPDGSVSYPFIRDVEGNEYGPID